MKIIYKKLLAIQKIDLSFAKKGVNPFFKSKYLNLDDLNRELKPILNDLRLLVVHKTYKKEVVTMVIDVESEEKIQSCFPISETITDPQKVGSAITYAKRYNIGQLFNIITDKDDDGEATKTKVIQADEPFGDRKGEKPTGIPDTTPDDPLA